MRRLRAFALAGTAFAVAAGVALVAQTDATTPVRMTAAASAFLGSLDADQKKKATFGLDDPHRGKWYFTPQQQNKQSTRKGLRLEEMTPPQRTAAVALLKTGLSVKGFEQAQTIMGLENLLAEWEGAKGGNTRNPLWYFVSVFGEPSPTGKWGWRFEGHHLSVNYTLDKGEVISATPLLLASNPAEVKDGDKKGLRPLPDIEDQARALIKSLAADQDAKAKQPKEFGEIKEGQPTAAVGDPVGLTFGELTGPQRETFGKLLAAYTDRMPADLAAVETKRARAADPAKLYFAYAGNPEPGKPYTYRVQGPDFVVEFLNVQADSAKNPANHIHSSWRRIPVDFGMTP